MFLMRRILHLIVVIGIMPIFIFGWAAITAGILRESPYEADVSVLLVMQIFTGAIIAGLFCLTIYMMPFNREILNSRSSPIQKEPYIRLARVPIFAMLISSVILLLINSKGLPRDYETKDALIVIGHIFSPLLIYACFYFFGKRRFIKSIRSDLLSNHSDDLSH